MFRSHGFDVVEEDGERILDVTGSWSPQARRLVAGGKVTGLRLNYARGFKERSLGFLDDWPIRQLEVLARTITDPEPIYRLGGSLEHLAITMSDRARLDLARLPRLVGLRAGWKQVRGSLPAAAPTLRSLYLGGYDEADLRPLVSLRILERLRMKEMRGLRTLEGIEAMPLVKLAIVGARHLRDIDSLAALGRTLKDLSLDSSLGQVPAVNPIEHLPLLRHLNIGNCGPIESLKPIAPCTALETLYAYESTRISDGNLGVLLTLPKLTEVRMMNRRHYAPSVDAIRATLVQREATSG